jgi:histidinol phosphatase-like PHP family hydrolase
MAFSPMTEPALTQDMLVHSTFSDGANTIEENVAEAERIGLTELTCVEQVRDDTKWVPAYVAAIRDSRKRTPIVLRCAVEAKILDTYGCLDLPAELNGIDAVYAAGLGLDERDVSPDLIDSLAIAAAESDARVVVDEHWRCPAARTLRPFLRHGVPLLLGSGSHDSEKVGRYDYCAGVSRELQPLSSGWPERILKRRTQGRLRPCR